MMYFLLFQIEIALQLQFDNFAKIEIAIPFAQLELQFRFSIRPTQQLMKNDVVSSIPNRNRFAIAIRQFC